MTDPRGSRSSMSVITVTMTRELDDEPRYAITALAARSGVHVSTIRRYEEFGLIENAGTAAGIPLYSESDLDRVQRIRRLVDDLGVNLAGAAAILHLREQLLVLQRELFERQHAQTDRGR